MTACVHCRQEYRPAQAVEGAMDGGRAYASRCPNCGRVVAMRPSTMDDPEPVMPVLSEAEQRRAEFSKWLVGHGRLGADDV